MDAQTFDLLVESRVTKIKGTLKSKGGEYSQNDDRLYNFKRAAAITGETPYKALCGMFMKHLVSVLDMIEHPEIVTPYLVDEKIGDSINYLLLLEGLFREGLEEKVINTDEF